MSDLDVIVAKSLSALKWDGPGPLSKGEALTAALVLNKPEWLSDMGYTIAEAISRVGPEWIALVPQAAKEVTRRISLPSK